MRCSTTPPTGTGRALVVCALALLMLGACSDSTTSSSTTSGTTTTTAATATTSTTSTTTSTTIPPTTTTTVPIVTEGALVLVANASGIDGAALRLTQALDALGFDTAKATNAAGNEDKLAVSKIYVKPGGEPAAESIAMLMGGIGVFPMPTPAWITGGSEALGYVNVLVMLGDDRALKPLPGLLDR